MRASYTRAVFGWLTARRRNKLAAQPFPDAWEAILDADVALWRKLGDPAVRERLRDLIVVFVDEKHWEGCGGLVLEDRHRVVIAALSTALLLGREHALYDDVDSILVYPSTVVAPPRKTGLVVDESGTALLGEAHLRGPVILAWDDVLAGARGKGRRNVVFHELAHKIDMVDGAIDGTPPLPDRAARARWAEVCSKEYLELRARVAAGKRSFLDDYGATDEAEFFAVATEAYWCQPAKLRVAEPRLFAVLAAFYNFAPPE
jgi:Mlc titration factor MtfA (ptsG expression regulator)